MTVRRSALQAGAPLDQKRRWKRALHHAAKHYKGELHVGQPLWFWRRGANAAKKPTHAFWHQGVVISKTLATVWIAYRGSVVKCARSQVRPHAADDEAAHEHITEHTRDLGERLLHEGDFSYEDISGQVGRPVDSSPAPEENTATEHQKPDGEGQVDVDLGSRRRMRGKTRLTSLEQPSAPTANTSPDTTQQQTKEDHDDKRRRIYEHESTVPTVAQDEVLELCPEAFDSVTRDDEIAVDVPLLEETVEMSDENSQGWITEEAFFTVSLGARQVLQRKEVKMKQLSPAERDEFLKSMEVEWQTLLQNQAAKVVSLEETTQARARWPDRADDSKPSGRRAKARLIIKGFTDPDLLDIESHSPTLTREGFMTVLQSVCSHGHKLQFGDVHSKRSTLGTRPRENNHSLSECLNGVPGEPRGVWVQPFETVNGLADGMREWTNCFLAAARGLGFETSVLEPCVLVLRSSQRRYHGIIGVTVDEITGGGDEVWEQAISKLKQRFTFGHWEVGK